MEQNSASTETIVLKKRRGRKPSGKRKGYFYETEENAFVEYLTTTNNERKEEIFNNILMPAFTKMTESIIRRYNLYPPDEDFKDTFDDTISFLMTKIENFKPESGYKAYSYCGTIIKNYLIYKINQIAKNQKRNTSYDAFNNDELSGINDAIRYSYDANANSVAFLGELLKKTANDIENTLASSEKDKLTENQIKVGKALVNLLTNWEELFAQMGSNKLNKSSILFYLKEMTLLNTKEIRDSMKIYKTAYYDLKNKLINE